MGCPAVPKAKKSKMNLWQPWCELEPHTMAAISDDFFGWPGCEVGFDTSTSGWPSPCEGGVAERSKKVQSFKRGTPSGGWQRWLGRKCWNQKRREVDDSESLDRFPSEEL